MNQASQSGYDEGELWKDHRASVGTQPGEIMITQTRVRHHI